MIGVRQDLWVFSTATYPKLIRIQPLHEKICSLQMRKTKAQISCAVIAQLISAFVLATKIVQFLFFHFCGCTARFVSDLVGNHEDRFSRDAAKRTCTFVHILCTIYPGISRNTTSTVGVACRTRAGYVGVTGAIAERTFRAVLKVGHTWIVYLAVQSYNKYKTCTHK